MSLIDDARRLHDGDPPSIRGSRSDNVRVCRNCNSPINSHAPNCPWLSMPKIVAVLEAAERTVTVLHRARAALTTLRDVGNHDVLIPDDIDVEAVEALMVDIQALAAALKGEEPS